NQAALGLPGCIQVSAPTYELLQEHYNFERRGSLEIKGKGKMLTYLLLGKKHAISKLLLSP
ncbi:MAG: adenylate/guanylate cyclase domain-containing protein, partial [Symploca sp. SIO1C4]|nr:adenylate/guanylate cyclase domain-containing protein [Symploca sp. SIO1C4]